MCVHSSWNPWELLPSFTEKDKFRVFSPPPLGSFMLNLDIIFVGMCCDIISQVDSDLFGLKNQTNKTVVV